MVTDHRARAARPRQCDISPGFWAIVQLAPQLGVPICAGCDRKDRYDRRQHLRPHHRPPPRRAASADDRSGRQRSARRRSFRRRRVRRRVVQWRRVWRRGRGHRFSKSERDFVRAAADARTALRAHRCAVKAAGCRLHSAGHQDPLWHRRPDRPRADHRRSAHHRDLAVDRARGAATRCAALSGGADAGQCRAGWRGGAGAVRGRRVRRHVPRQHAQHAYPQEVDGKAAAPFKRAGGG